MTSPELPSRNRKRDAVRVAKTLLKRAELSSGIGQASVGKFRDLSAALIRHRAVGSVLDFAQAATQRHDEIAADVYVACDVTSLAAAHALASAGDGQRVICDVREIPDLSHRSLPKDIPAVDLLFLNRACQQLLADCDSRITVGPTLQRHLKDLGLSTTVVANYLHRSEPTSDGQLHRRLGLPTTARIVAVPNTIVAGAEGLIGALGDLDSDVHIVFIGNTKPFSYRSSLETLVDELGLHQRVHWVEPVPYTELADLLSSATVGAVLLDPSIPNHRVAYPNRLFDAMSGHLPIATSNVADINEVIATYGCGQIAESNTATHWAAAIRTVLTDVARYRAGTIEALRHMNWRAVEPALLDAIGLRPGQRITFLHPTNLHRNQRTLRMIETLSHAGIDCAIATGVDSPGEAAKNYRLVDVRR